MDSGTIMFIGAIVFVLVVLVIVNAIRNSYLNAKDRQKREQDMRNGLYNESQKQNLSDRFK